jgi:sulfur-carrier protein
MKITVRYFASLREALGGGETLDIAAGDNVASVRDALLRRSPVHAEALDRKRALRCALNQTLCDESAVLAQGAEVAFFPPVTGG